MKYGDEIASRIFKEEGSYASKAGIQDSNFKPDDSRFKFLVISKNWYLAGSTKCMIEGMEKLAESPKEMEKWDRIVRSADEFKMTFMSNANTAAEEITQGTIAGGFRDGKPN